MLDKTTYGAYVVLSNFPSPWAIVYLSVWEMHTHSMMLSTPYFTTGLESLKWCAALVFFFFFDKIVCCIPQSSILIFIWQELCFTSDKLQQRLLTVFKVIGGGRTTVIRFSQLPWNWVAAEWWVKKKQPLLKHSFITFHHPLRGKACQWSRCEVLDIELGHGKIIVNSVNSAKSSFNNEDLLC